MGGVDICAARLVSLVGLAGVLGACGGDDDPGSPDGGGGSDAGRRDAGAMDGGPADTGAPDAGPPDAGPPPTIASGTWLLSAIEREPSLEGRCWSTLMNLEIATDRVVIGGRRIECGDVIETVSDLELGVSGDRLLLGGEDVGSLGETTLDVTLPGGLGTFAIDLGASAHQLTDVSDTRTYRAAMTPMPDDRPIALVDTLAATEDEPLSARVHAARLPETVPVFAVVADPSSGSLASFDFETGALTYQGDSDFFGSDSFRFSVSDGTLPATEAVVTLDVAGTPDAPVARSQSVTTPEDTAIGIALDASDADGDPLTLTITTPPASGSLAGTLPAPTYTPNADYAGSDSFAYRVSDGTASSAPATVSITVSPVNDRPVALPQAVTTRGTNRARILLRATDVDDTSLTYAVTRAPTGGTLTGTAPNLVYRATAGFTGADTFAFTASDATLTSTEAIVTVDVLPAIYSTEVLSSSFPISLVERLVAPSRIYFTGYHSTSGSSLWVTDGTPTGTTLVHAEGARSTSFSHAASAYFALGASEYYVYPSDYPAMQLRAGTDGSVIAPLPSPDETVYRAAAPVIGSPVVAGGTAYVHVNWSGSAGGVCEIWATDGTAGGTRLVNSVARHCRGIHDGGGTFYYFEGFDLMTFTAAAETPALIATIPAGILGWLGTAGGYHFFSRQHTVGSGVTGTTYVELWRTDGTAGGTMLVDTIDTGYITRSIYYPTALGGLLYFSHRRSLHESDGTTAGTGIVWNVPATSYGASGAISYMSAVNGALLFQARTDATGGEPWVSDGTSAGTTLLADVNPRNDVGSMRDGFEAFDGLAFFGADDGAIGATLWRTDGTAAGTELAVDVPAERLLGVIGDRLVVYGGSSVTAVFRP